MDGDTSDVVAFGKLDNGKAPDGDTVYEIGSITKTFTPFMGFHHVNPLADFDMSTVGREVFGSIAARTRCCIEIANHLTKKGDEVAGAPALIHAMHAVRVVTAITASDANLFGIPTRDRKRHVKVASNTDSDVVCCKLEKINFNGDQINIAVPWRPAIGIGKTATARSSRSARAGAKTAHNVTERASRGQRRNQLQA